MNTGADAICAVLAGGASRRMGRPKAIEPLAGRPLIAYPLEAAREAGLEAAVVAKPGSPLPELDVRVILEPPEPRHPLCGIVTVLRESGGRAVVAVGCDMPFVAAGLISHLASLGAALAVCRVGGRLQPLLGRYEPSLLPHLENALEAEFGLSEAVAALEPHVVGDSELARFGDPSILTFNVNDPFDLASAEERLAGERSS